MTLIIGAWCRDGIVVGADTIATYGTPFGMHTIEQEVKSKITVESGNVIVATSGSVGLSQLMMDGLTIHWDQIKGLPVSQARTAITQVLWSQINPAIQRARVAQQLVGDNALSSAICTCLVALPVGNNHVLLHFDTQAASEACTPDLPMVAIGSGQQQADPFLAFVKRVIWNNEAPATTAAGILGVLWTLKHVIKVNAGFGVGGRPTIAVLENHNGKWIGEELDADRLGEHEEAVDDAENLLQEFAEGLTASRFPEYPNQLEE